MTQVPIEKIQKKKRSLLVLKFIIPTLLVFLLVVNFFPVKEIKQKSFFKNNRPMVIAHQGGELLTVKYHCGIYECHEFGC
jgi:glycerophosphoryl diester phosphodiesterase